MTIVSNPLARFLLHGQPRGLCALTDDILLDFVFVHLSVRDILSLRGTCRTLHNLTHHPTVWKRILRTFDAPLPPLPPTMRYSLGSLTSMESERLITRALSADVNWRSERPRAWQVWKVPLFWQVLSLKMLPGGQHMVAAVKRAPMSYGLLLVKLDHHEKTAYPTAMFSTGALKPYGIDTKYTEFEGEPRIMISYLSRECAHQRDRDAGVDVQDYADYAAFDFPVRVRFELVVLHCGLSALQDVEGASPGTPEYMEKMMETPTIFQTASIIRSNKPFEFTELDVRIEREEGMITQDPCVVWVQGDCIKLKNLRTRDISSFTCGPVDANLEEPEVLSSFRIRGIRMLPPQGELLVVRTSETSGLALQLYTIPPPGAVITDATPRQQRLYREEQGPSERVYLEIAISSHNLPLPRDNSLLATLAPHAEPPPLYVYAISNLPWGATMFRLWPQRVKFDSARNYSDTFNADVFAAEEEDSMQADAEADASSDDEAGSVFQSRKRRANAPRTKDLLQDTTFRYSVRPVLNSYIIPNTFTHDFIAPAATSSAQTPSSEMSQRLQILPGCTRALLVGTDPADRSIAPRLLNLHAFADMHGPVRREARWADDVRREEAARRQHGWVKGTAKEREDMNAIAPLLYGVADVQQVFEGGVVAVGWDDWAARICMVPQTMPTVAYLLEFAHSPREDPRGHRLPLSVPYDSATGALFRKREQNNMMDWEV